MQQMSWLLNRKIVEIELRNSFVVRKNRRKRQGNYGFDESTSIHERRNEQMCEWKDAKRTTRLKWIKVKQIVDWWTLEEDSRPCLFKGLVSDIVHSKLRKISICRKEIIVRDWNLTTEVHSKWHKFKTHSSFIEVWI